MEKWTPHQFVAVKEICRIATKANLKVSVVEEDANGDIRFPDNELKTYPDLVKFIFQCDGILITPKKGVEESEDNE